MARQDYQRYDFSEMLVLVDQKLLVPNFLNDFDLPIWIPNGDNVELGMHNHHLIRNQLVDLLLVELRLLGDWVAFIA